MNKEIINIGLIIKNIESLFKCRQCHPDSLDASKVKGKVVLCDGRNDEYSTGEIIETVKNVGGIGLVHITDSNGAIASYYGDFPATVISPKDGATILQYINSSKYVTVLVSEIVFESCLRPRLNTNLIFYAYKKY